MGAAQDANRTTLEVFDLVPGVDQVADDGVPMGVPRVDGYGAVRANDKAKLRHQSAPLPSARVITKLVQTIVSAAVIAVVFRIMSALDVPQVPCRTAVPAWFNARK